MLRVEFEADVHNGKIEIPAKYRKQLGKHIKLIALTNEKAEETIQYSDEYIEEHWQKLIHQGLSHYDGGYYKSEQYYLDRGKEGMEKYA